MDNEQAKPIWWSPQRWLHAERQQPESTSGPEPTRDQPDRVDRQSRWEAAPGERRRARERRPNTAGWARSALRRFRGLPRPLAGALVALFLLVCALLCVGASNAYLALSAASVGRYQADLKIARTGADHLQTAATDMQQLLQGNPLDGAGIARAHDEMAAAHADFARLSPELASVPPVAALLPHYGHLLVAGQRLLPIALDSSAAGIVATADWALLADRLHDPLDPSAAGITPADLHSLQGDARLIVALFTDLSGRVGALQPADLQVDPRIGPAMARLRDNLPRIQSGLEAYTTLLAAAPGLLGVGESAHYLVEILDSTELRPGGGFIGNVGILTLGGGRMSDLHIEDVDVLDGPFRYGPHAIPLPQQYSWFTIAGGHWGLRDSNLEADFPTSAQYGEQLYSREGGAVPLQGVIAVTPWLVEDALKLTGPIAVPEFQETVTADNLIDRIHYHQLTSAGVAGPGDSGDTNGSSFRKRFTADLFQHFLERAKALSSTHLGDFARLLTGGVHTKDVQIYLNMESAEQVLAQHHLADVVEAPASGDSLYVVDTNNAAIKANAFLTYQLSDAVTLAPNGDALHHTTLTYAWPANPASLTLSYPAQTPGLYRGYLRVYAPPNARLQQQSGWQPHPTTAAFDRQVWGGDLAVSYGATTAIDLIWTSPGAATRDGSGWRYRALIQKQPGITYPLRLAITPPSCATAKTAPSGFTRSGGALSQTLPLTSDVSATLDYTTPTDGCAG